MSSTSSSDSSDSSSRSSHELEEIEFTSKTLPNRITRGTRYKKKTEDDQDFEFWDQDAWAEHESDERDAIHTDDFSEREYGDSADSDIDLPEDSEENEAQLAKFAEKRAKLEDEGGVGKKRRNEDPALAVLKKRLNKGRMGKDEKGNGVSGEGTGGGMGGGISRGGKGMGKVRKGGKGMAGAGMGSKGEGMEDAPKSTSPRNVRKSTQIATHHIKTKLEAVQKKERVVYEKQRVQKMTNEEMLRAASLTEVENKRALVSMMVIQEEKKRMREAANDNPAERGPRIIYKSSVAQPEQWTFTDESMFPKAQTLPEITKPLICAVTGLPAKYRLPKTLTPFANLDAYRQLKIKTGN